MIRKIVVTSLLVVCALSAAAQRPRARIEWGVLGGINIPDYTTNMSGTDVKNKLGWQAGITTAVNLGAFAVEPQILYVRQGLRIRPEGQKEINLKSNSIDVPVLLSFRLLRPVRIYAGPVFTVMNDCKQKSGATCSISAACVPRCPTRWVRASSCWAICWWTCATTASSKARRTWCFPTAASSTNSARITWRLTSDTFFSL